MSEPDPTLVNNFFQDFGIKAECLGAMYHRHFVNYKIRIKPGGKISKINSLIKELGLYLKSTTIPIVNLETSEGLILIEATTSPPEILSLGSLYTSGSGNLPFVFGESSQGETVTVDMTSNPHLLVAGTTGSGKSVFLHTLISNASKFDNLDLYLTDTKRVEFQKYKNEKQVKGLSESYSEALDQLRYLHSMMELRYAQLYKMGHTSIHETKIFNNILIIVDEVSDLILQDKNGALQDTLVKLAQKSRAAGIYLVLATQHPSVNILTGSIKANFPARLSCKVNSRSDSQVILDSVGAENLYGRGDALFKSPTTNLTRLQIACA